MKNHFSGMAGQEGTAQGNSAPGVAEIAGGVSAQAGGVAGSGAGDAGSAGAPFVSGELPGGMEHLADRKLAVRTVAAGSGAGSGAGGSDGDGVVQGGEQGGEQVGANADGTPGQGSGGAENGTPQEAPLADPGEVSIVFPEGMPVDEAMLNSYRRFCVDSGLNARQAQEAADFYLAEQARRMGEERESSLRSLREGAWAGRFEERLAQANYATHVLDRQMGGRLRPLLAAGLGNNGVFAEMMAVIGESISEDAFSAQPGAYAASAAPMSTEEFLRTEVFRNA